jgi:hypothetical protein
MAYALLASRAGGQMSTGPAAVLIILIVAALVLDAWGRNRRGGE